MSATPKSVAVLDEDRNVDAPPVISRGLVCRECATQVPHGATHVCELCFGPLEVDYALAAAAAVMTRELVASRRFSMWRYAELLPAAAPPPELQFTGGTPLVPAPRLAARLGLSQLWVKNDAVCHPSLSFKDRVVSVALAKAKELGFTTVACASTGNLANSVAANAAALGLASIVFIPRTLEPMKIIATQIYGGRVIAVDGTYDDVNRLCSEISERYPWAFVNINLRPYYAEGSKTIGFEIADQLGWTLPDHIVAPMASGSLVTKLAKSWKELFAVGLLDDEPQTKIHGAQATGCSPIAEAMRAGRELIKPVKEPQTIARSLAIGNPADGFYAVRAMQKSGGSAAQVTDEAIVAGMRLLAETEGIFTETAGGVTVAGLQQLIAEGAIERGSTAVVCITGQGLKTTDPLTTALASPPVIAPRLSELQALLKD